jgi:hypothetical protein
MRRYGSNITVGGGRDDKVESLVLDLLEQTSRRATGALILSEIAINSVRKVKIVPSVPKKRGVAVDAQVSYPPLPRPGAGVAVPGDPVDSLA